MMLTLKRDQKSSGMISKAVTFSLGVRAEISEAEREAIRKYKMGDLVLYDSKEAPEFDDRRVMGSIASTIMWRATTVRLHVNDLANGKTFECKDILEMLATEEQIKQAAVTFKRVLDAAATFGGEETIEM